jgi:hypothetical protein
MNYITVENPIWNHDRTMVDCVVDFVNLGKVPFSASPNDLPHSVEIYNRCVAGDFGPIGDYVPHIDEGDNPQSTGPLPPEMRIPATTPGAIL